MIDKNKVYGFLNNLLSFAQSHYKDVDKNASFDKYLDHPDMTKARELFLKLNHIINIDPEQVKKWGGPDKYYIYDDISFDKLNSAEQKLAGQLLDKYLGEKNSLNIIKDLQTTTYTGLASHDLKNSGNIHYGGVVYKPEFSKDGKLLRYKNLDGSGANMPTMEDILQSDERDARSSIFEKGYMIDTDDNGNINIINPEKEAEKYAQINKYKDLTARQEDELTKQYASQANQTDWVKIAIYVIIAIIVAYIIYRIIKWIYKWYKKRKAAKQLQNESVSYNFFNYRLCEADETHQVGKLYNSMMNPIINFFKRVFSGSLSVLSYISNTISNFSKKVYQLFTNTFRQKKPMDELKQEYVTISNKINNLCKSPILRSKLDNIQTVLPKV